MRPGKVRWAMVVVVAGGALLPVSCTTILNALDMLHTVLMFADALA